MVFHESEIYNLPSFFVLCCNVVAWRNLQNFIHANVVVCNIFHVLSFLKKLIEQSRIKNLTNSMLRTCPVILNVLKLREYFNHLLSIDGHILVQKLFNAVRTKIQKHGQLFQLIWISGFIHMDDVGKDI
jgi:hypothetical protein